MSYWEWVWNRRLIRSSVETTSVIVGAIACLAGTPAMAQVIGEEAEMERLLNKAEETIANGDADGAAMNMGKAALMAAHLAKQQEISMKAQWFLGAEALFRAQEQAYRAQALFERAGGQVPASSGVCGSMSLARQYLDKSRSLFVDAVPTNARWQQLGAAASDWVKTIDGMSKDFQCQ
jgi:hypothetical protein